MPLNIMVIGDSKTQGAGCCIATGGYQPYLVDQLFHSDQNNDVEIIDDLSSGGWTAATVLGLLPAFIAAQTQDPDWVLISLGSNDVNGLNAGTLTAASFKSDYGDILDAIHAEWPSAKVRLMRILNTAFSAEADAIDDTYIPEILTGRESFAAVGPDERVFLPPDVADYTHPTLPGYIKTATEWRLVMGY